MMTAVRFVFVTCLAGALASAGACASSTGTMTEPDAVPLFDGSVDVQQAVADSASVDVTVAVVPDAGVDADEDAACPDVETVLFPTACGGCHGGGQKMGELDLTAPDVGKRLFGKPANGDAGVLLIDPVTPAKSAVYLKLLAPPPFGARMPPNMPLSASRQACVLTWIESVVAGDAGADGGDAASDASDAASE